MTSIYCVKCRDATDTKSEKLVTTKKGRHRLTGICATCGTKKGMFVSKDGTITKTLEEREDAKIMRGYYSRRKKAEDIGWKVLENPEAEECVKKCLAKTGKKNK
jgi:hypothetical protein